MYKTDNVNSDVFTPFSVYRAIQGLIMDAFRITRVQWNVEFLQQKGRKRVSAFFGHALWFLTKLLFLHVFC